MCFGQCLRLRIVISDYKPGFFVSSIVPAKHYSILFKVLYNRYISHDKVPVFSLCICESDIHIMLQCFSFLVTKKTSTGRHCLLGHTGDV